MSKISPIQCHLVLSVTTSPFFILLWVNLLKCLWNWRKTGYWGKSNWIHKKVVK